MTVADIERALALIIANAPALIAAGVRGTVAIGEIRFALSEPPGEAPAAPALVESEVDDALRDPATHGMFGDDARGPMPRRRREPLLPEG